MPPELSKEPSEFVVKARMVGKRIDAYLAARYPDFSRSVIQKVIDAEAVLINGQPTKASYRVREGDEIRVWLPDLGDGSFQAEDIPIGIVYEDDLFTVVNKPAGLITHPGRGNWSGTLVNALQFHFDNLSSVGGDNRPGIVHRLDRDTSGLLIVAKDDKAHRELVRPVRGPDDPQGISGPGLRHPFPRQRLHREAARHPSRHPRKGRHPGPRRRRQGGRDLLRGARTVRRLRPRPLPAEDGSDPPDPGPPRPHRPPDPRR